MLKLLLLELKEECGIDGVVQGLVGMRECLIEQTPAIILAYYINTENLIVSIDNDEIDDFGWFVEENFEDQQQCNERNCKKGFDGLQWKIN